MEEYDVYKKAVLGLHVFFFSIDLMLFLNRTISSVYYWSFSPFILISCSFCVPQKKESNTGFK